MGGNKAVRDWVGGGLKALGETLEAEEEAEEGERAEVVREVFVSSSTVYDFSADLLIACRMYSKSHCWLRNRTTPPHHHRPTSCKSVTVLCSDRPSPRRGPPAARPSTLPCPDLLLLPWKSRGGLQRMSFFLELLILRSAPLIELPEERERAKVCSAAPEIT